MFGGGEIWIIAIVVLILFGASAIPRFARNLGKAKKEFEKGMREGLTDDEKDEDSKDTRKREKRPADDEK